MKKQHLDVGDNLTFIIILLIVMVSILLGGYLDSKAQTVVPNAILDTMIMEVKYSRQCGIALEAIQAENKALGEELLHTGTALELSQRSSETLSALLNNSKEANTVLSIQFQKDLNSERRKTRRWRKIGIIQAVVIIGITLTLK